MGGTGLFLLLVAVLLASPEGIHSFYFIEGEEPEGVIVEMFEWTFANIAEECEKFLGPKGYAGVQVSPVTESIMLNGRPWSERYQPVSYKINSKSGNEDDFKEMVRRCNGAQVKVYVEVVLNHMSKSHDGPIRTFGGSDVDLKEYSYHDVPYSKEHFHNPCKITDENDVKQLRNCEVDGLHDLDQSKAYVRCAMSEFLNKMIHYGVSGFSIDSAKNMWPKELQQIFNRLDFLNHYEGFAYMTPPFIYQDVTPSGAIKPEEYYESGYVTDYNYGITVSQVIQKKMKLSKLKNIGAEGSQFIKSNKALVFIDNHLTERGLTSGAENVLSYTDIVEYKLALIFMLAWPHGLPRILSGYAFRSPEAGAPTSTGGFFQNLKFSKDICGKDWLCQHRWKEVYNMVEFRRIAQTEEVNHWWDNDKDRFAFGRGSQAFVVFNLDKKDRIKKKLFQTSMEPGEYCDVISGELNAVGICSGTLVSVDKDGVAKITVEVMSALAIHTGVKVPWRNTKPAVVYSKAVEKGTHAKVKTENYVKEKASAAGKQIKDKAKKFFGG